MTDIIFAFIELGIGLLAATLFSLLFSSTISFWITSKIFGSINDEFITAIKATIYLLILSFIIGALDGGITWLDTNFGFTSVLEIISWFILALILFSGFMILKNVYDLSYGKTFGFVVASFVIQALLSFALIFGVGTIFGVNLLNEITENTNRTLINSNDSANSESSDLNLTETHSNPEDNTPSLPTSNSGGPSIPRIPTSNN